MTTQKCTFKLGFGYRANVAKFRENNWKSSSVRNIYQRFQGLTNRDDQESASVAVVEPRLDARLTTLNISWTLSSAMMKALSCLRESRSFCTIDDVKPARAYSITIW